MDLLPKPEALQHHHSNRHSLLRLRNGATSTSQWTSLAAQRSAAAREQEDAETIALQRSALQSASAMIRTLQERLQLLESNTIVTPSPTPTPRFTPSPPPASTSSAASLRLQALAHGLQVESLRLQVEEVQSRSVSRAGSEAGDLEVERKEEGESEEESEMSEEEDEEVEGMERFELTERDYLRWVDERRLEEGEVDADGVPVRRRRGSALRSKRQVVVRERVGR
ncbi:hypothetical protein BCR35DRAFT_300934 [Leucosporidium creatinivorum]|uniref:Uncharacterized protein n=1 Tax=Leucosporidium creatinivorum TaxID=106004 RepID=A0A1Y2FYJ8_9BASI|nr:hypothetical protein BCR35DRAFT_300934 [Leucosporidium creatinivorum]